MNKPHPNRSGVLGFSPSELQLPGLRWKALVRERRDVLDPKTSEWLADWEIWDLPCSPMDDAQRALIRYGPLSRLVPKSAGALLVVIMSTRRC